MERKNFIFTFIFLILCTFYIISPLGSGESLAANTNETSTSSSISQTDLKWQDYNGKKLGVLTGTLFEQMAKDNFPDSELLYYKSYPDCIAALEAGYIDAYLADEPSVKMSRAENPKVDYLPERITENRYSFAFRKNDERSKKLRTEFNEFINKIRSDGTLQTIDDKWFGSDESKKVLDMSDLTEKNGKIRVVTTSTDAPFSYIKEGKNVGYDIEIVVRFCREKGYALELGDVDFDARIPAVQSGKYDFSTDMNVTDERKEEVDFSDATSYGGVVLAVLKAENDSQPLLSSLLNSFTKTFIREDRYKLFLQGILTTVIVTFLSIILGTILGFIIYMFCRNGNIFTNKISSIFSWLIQGIPVVVLLMILYYIIFAQSTISNVIVAIIAFTLVFASAMFSMLKMGVGAVPKGQQEAAEALGYGDTHLFFRIIFPQALPHFLPTYKAEVISLLKGTAVVGYIAVQDLTKMGDIVRGRTYDALFSLIAVAVIYFILEGILTFIINRIQIIINPKRRKAEKILKGVETDD